MEDFKSELVRQLASILSETGLSEIEYDTGDIRVRVAKHAEPVYTAAAQPAPALVPSPATPAAAAAPATEDDLAAHPGCVKAPMVGVAYLSPEPGAQPFIRTGDSVSKGQTLLLVEAMKTFNPVKAPKDGAVKSILVADGQPIEFDQPLAVIE